MLDDSYLRRPLPRTRTPWIAVALVAVVLFASACGSSSDRANAASGADDTVAASDGADSSNGDSDGADDGTVANDAVDDSASEPDDGGGESDGPQTINDLLGTAALIVRGGGGGGGGGGPLGGADLETIAQEQQLIEIEVQRCMQAEGFTYVPEETGNGLRFFIATTRQGISEQDYAETEGFGISTRFDAIFDGEIDLTDDADPNDEHLATLSEGERDAWQFALRGAPPERNEQGQLIDPETGEVIRGGGRGQATGGCRLDAQQEIRGDIAELAVLEDEFAALDERIDADTRIAEIRRDWSACMLDSGFDYTDTAEARAYFNGEIRPLLRSFFQASGAAQGGQQGGGQGGALQALADIGLDDEQEAQLQQLQDLEIATAVASLACAGDGPAEIQEITERYEAEFIENNRAVLEAFSN